MEDERDSANIPLSTESDRSGSRSGFKLSTKLRTRIAKLEKWRISPSSIKSPKYTRQFHGGHATVSKAFLLRGIGHDRFESYTPREVMQLCRQSPESDDHIRGAADHRRDAEGELGDEEKDGEQKYEFDRDGRWRGELALRETEFLVKLSHPNIVKLEGFVEDLSKGIIWVVFLWAENGNLKDFVASRDWEIPERISLINDVAGGLEYLHSRKPPICHGDLKSLNVLVNSAHRAVITDFGSARRLTEHDLNRPPGPVQSRQQPLQAKFSHLSKTITLTGNIYTLRWAAPELLNDDQMTLWSDIWALGWIAYEVLTNSIPFQDVPADAVVVERVIQGNLPSINEDARVSLFGNLCSLMTMCWNSNPSERPTAKDYLRAVCKMPMLVPQDPEWQDIPESPAEFLMQRGQREEEFGDLVMALACFTEAGRMYARIGDREGKVDALDYLALLHRHRKEYSEAIACYAEILQIRSDIGDRRGRADALWGLAQVHRARKEYSQAIAHYSLALRIRTDMGDRRGRADALRGLAEVHQAREQYSEAIALYSEVLQIRTDMGDREGRADTLWYLGLAHHAREEYSEAITLYSEALQIRTDIGDREGRADVLWFLAYVHQAREEYSEAITHYSEVLQICTKIGDRKGRADALSGLADIHRHQGHHDDAISLYEQAAEIFEQSRNVDAAADALKKAADTCQRLKLVK